jgi:hypothetical protein
VQTDEAFRICQEGYFSAFQLHSHVNFNNSEDIAQSIPAWGTRIERKAFFSRFPDGNGLILDAILSVHYVARSHREAIRFNT